MFKDNVKALKKAIDGLGYKVGIVDKDLNKLDRKAFKEILSSLEEDYTDVFITMNNELYVVEIATVDNEKDVMYYEGYQYFKKYGNLYDAYEVGDITEEQYNDMCNILDL